LDAVETAELNSGKDEARMKRKSLNAAVDTLMRRTHNLHKDFVATLEKLKNGQLEDDIPITFGDFNVAPTSAATQSENTTGSNNRPDTGTGKKKSRRRGGRGRGQRGAQDREPSEALVRAVQEAVAMPTTSA
jgi:hypothetical protein